MATIIELPPELPLRRFRRSEFEYLAYNGYFEDERVELLDGLIVKMSPHSPPHSHGVRTIDSLLQRAIGDRAVVQAQLTLVLDDYSMLEPDVAIVATGDYSAEHPTSALLVVEVSVSSLSFDRGPKGRLYARAGVPEYWVVNVEGRVIEVYSEPGPDGYASVRVVREDEEIAPIAFPDVRFTVRAVLPTP